MEPGGSMPHSQGLCFTYQFTYNINVIPGNYVKVTQFFQQ